MQNIVFFLITQLINIYRELLTCTLICFMSFTSRRLVKITYQKLTEEDGFTQDLASAATCPYTRVYLKVTGLSR